MGPGSRQCRKDGESPVFDGGERLLRRLTFPWVWLAVVWILLAVARPSPAGIITGSYELSWEQDVDRIEAETTDVRKTKHTLELKYAGLLSPVVTNEATFKLEQEINSDTGNITRLLPTLDLGFMGNYWEAKTGAKETHENSDEPEQNPKVSKTYFVELFYLAPRRVPDLKAKYTLDTDFEEGTSDTDRQEITMSSVYQATEWLDLKGDYSRILNTDNLTADSDTEEEKYSAAATIRHFVSSKIRINLEYDLEISRKATLLDAGGTTNKAEDQTHSVKSSLAIKPFRDTTIDGSYDYDLKQNIEEGEHTQTSKLKVALDQRVGKPLDLRAEFLRNIDKDLHTNDDNTKTEDTYTLEAKAKFSDLLDITVKYEKKDTDEIHVDPSKNILTVTELRNATWTGELAAFWKASVSYDKQDETENGVQSKIETKYNLQSTFDFKAIRLTLDPTYDVTLTDDLKEGESQNIRDFKFKIAWKVFSTRNMESTMEHTYGRKTDSNANNIERTDNSTANVTWTDPFPGWIFGFDLTRVATDTSEDDLEPDITTTFGFKADYSYRWFSLATSYKYDKKSLTANAETFEAKVGWTAPKWDANLTYTFDKTFSEALDEGYTIVLAFKYNL